ncbi:MAG: hypothetical protein N0A16_06880 [Blastocatellia bacterium]|nr:hypothetical protein [Blastocatellia bacterium]MCS7157434.1 hypothetical protein [Blastocatellia bacterium]MCX7752608.1 hypothetical protein [Blastocatellia bacterium]MDW8168339.1 hypothetical protein [Acidobacteriota bacterium]MDW8255535.1 hypothetical protein [Acidobacteriota bacterium]
MMVPAGRCVFLGIALRRTLYPPSSCAALSPLLIAPWSFLLLTTEITSALAEWKRAMAIGLVSLSMILGLKADYRTPSFDSDYWP